MDMNQKQLELEMAKLEAEKDVAEAKERTEVAKLEAELSCTTVVSRWRPECRRNRSSDQTFWFWLLNLPLIDRPSSCQETIVSCLAVAQVEAKDVDHKK